MSLFTLWVILTIMTPDGWPKTVHLALASNLSSDQCDALMLDMNEQNAETGLAFAGCLETKPLHP